MSEVNQSWAKVKVVKILFNKTVTGTDRCRCRMEVLNTTRTSGDFIARAQVGLGWWVFVGKKITKSRCQVWGEFCLN